MRKLAFGETRIHHMSLAASQYLRAFLRKSVVTLLNAFFSLHTIMSQYLEDLHNLVNQYFPNDVTKSCLGKKDSVTASGELVDLVDLSMKSH